jgi:hypothetical protein
MPAIAKPKAGRMIHVGAIADLGCFIDLLRKLLPMTTTCCPAEKFRKDIQSLIGRAEVELQKLITG